MDRPYRRAPRAYPRPRGAEPTPGGALAAQALVCALLLALLLALRLIQTPGLQAARQAVKAALTGDTGLTNLTDGWEALTDSLGGLRQNFQGLLEEPEAAPPAGTPRVDEDILRALDRPDPYGGF